MDFTWNGYEFLFEIEKIRLLYGKYNYAAKTTEVRDDETRTIVATSIGPKSTDGTNRKRERLLESRPRSGPKRGDGQVTSRRLGNRCVGAVKLNLTRPS
jgi:hypothetical protein